MGIIKLVRQEEAYGCGIACCAMISGLSYAEVSAVIGPAGRGFGHHVWQEFLNRHGFASQLVYRHDCIAKQDRTSWPPETWAELHICSVDAGHGFGSHLVVVLHDGTVLDPARDEPARMSDYSGFAYMAAVFPVGVRPTPSTGA